MVGRTRSAVQLKRHFLRIPPRWEKRRAWTANEDALLGTLPDAELAKKLNRSVSSVRSRRLHATKLRFLKTPQRWQPTEVRLLGRMPDRETARRTGRLLISVQRKRNKLGIPRYKPNC
jgi:hypothetical protein